MPDMEKVINELHDARRYLENKEWSDRGASPHIDAINDALTLLKELEEQVKSWTKQIADNQLAHAPDERNPEEWDYCKGIWDGLQIAWNIISEGR